jgi:hypothetical protein
MKSRQSGEKFEVESESVALDAIKAELESALK